MTSLRPRCPPCSHCGDGPPSSIPSPPFPRPTLGEVVRIRWEEEISDDQSDPCEHRPGASKHLPGCGVSGAAEQWDQRRPGPQQEPTGHLPWPSPGRAWGQSRPPPPSAPASEAPGDSWDVRSKQTDKQAHSPTSSPVRGWPPRDAAFSPSPVPGQGPGSQHKRWQWYPPFLPSSPPRQPLFRQPGQSRTPSTASSDGPAAPGLAPCPALAPAPLI